MDIGPIVFIPKEKNDKTHMLARKPNLVKNHINFNRPNHIVTKHFHFIKKVKHN